MMKQEGTGNEAVVAYSNKINLHLPGRTEEIHKTFFFQDSRSPELDLYPEPPDDEAGVLTSQPHRLLLSQI